MSHCVVAALAHSERLLGIARRALGDGGVPFRATLFEKSAGANWFVVWHQDTALPLQTRFDAPGWGPWSVKGGIYYAHAPTWALSRVLALRVHLDESDGDNGPLRVIPGSHTLGVCSEARSGCSGVPWGLTDAIPRRPADSVAYYFDNVTFEGNACIPADFINTPLQRGDGRAGSEGNRFNGF